jgi:hypothetical protein
MKKFSRVFIAIFGICAVSLGGLGRPSGDWLTKVSPQELGADSKAPVIKVPQGSNKPDPLFAMEVKFNQCEQSSNATCSAESALLPEKGPVGCGTVSIICIDEEGGGCWNDPNTGCGGCIIELSKAACATLGIETGDSFETGKLRDKALKTRPNTVDEAWNLCVAVHEDQHAIDGAGIGECQSEINANTAQLACIKSFYSQLCGGREPTLSEDQCSRFNSLVCYQAAKLEFQIARCANPEDGDCKAALDSCEDSLTRCLTFLDPPPAETVRARCNPLREVYCPRQPV